jgi:hypothetical protein
MVSIPFVFHFNLLAGSAGAAGGTMNAPKPTLAKTEDPDQHRIRRGTCMAHTVTSRVPTLVTV